MIAEGHQTEESFSLIQTRREPPGFGPPLHRHRDAAEAFYVLEGTYLMYTEDKQDHCPPENLRLRPTWGPAHLQGGIRGSRTEAEPVLASRHGRLLRGAVAMPRRTGRRHPTSLTGSPRSTTWRSSARCPTPTCDVAEPPLPTAGQPARGCCHARHRGWSRRRDRGRTRSRPAGGRTRCLNSAGLSKPGGFPAGPPGNRASPVNRWWVPAGSSTSRATDPGVCPRSPMTVTDSSPRTTVSPSSSGSSVRAGICAASARPAAVRAPVRSTTSARACQWSRWLWVVTTRSSPPSPRTPARVAASSAASTSEPSPAGHALEQVGVVLHRADADLGHPQAAGLADRRRVTGRDVTGVVGQRGIAAGRHPGTIRRASVSPGRRRPRRRCGRDRAARRPGPPGARPPTGAARRRPPRAWRR